MNAPERDLASLRINPGWAKLPVFDRTNWTRVRFGDVVESRRAATASSSGMRSARRPSS